MYHYNRLPDGVPLSSLCKALKTTNHNTLKSLQTYLLESFYCDHIIMTSSGRQALFLALQAIDPSKSDIILPAYGCPIVSEMVQAAGKIPIYVDIDPNTFTASPTEIIKAITKQTGAIILVHEFGNLIPQDAISFLRSRFDGIIIEDAASAMGSRYTTNKHFGNLSDMIIFSGSLGKPSGGIHWGALALANSFTDSIEILTKHIQQNTKSNISSIVKALTYNLIRQRGIYDITQRTLNYISKKNSKSADIVIQHPTDFNTRLIWQRYKILDNWAAQQNEKTNQLLNLLHAHHFKTIYTNGCLPVLTRIPFYIPDDSAQFIKILSTQNIEIQRPFNFNFSHASANRFPNTFDVLQNTISITVTKNIGDQFLFKLDRAIQLYMHTKTT